MTNVAEKGTDFVQDLGEAVRNNPISAALIGMGVLWLFTGSRPAERASEFVRSARLDRIPEAAGNAFDAVRETVRTGTDAIGEHLTTAKATAREGTVETIENATRHGRDYAETASQYVGSIPSSGAEMLETVRSNLSDVFKAQPLALGAIGIAIGAGIAAALPPSQLETDYLGEASDTVKTKATEIAKEQADRVTAVAQNVMDAATVEARKQELTMESAKSAAGGVAAKVGRIVDAVGKGISKRTGNS